MSKFKFVNGQMEFIDNEVLIHDDRKTYGAGKRVDVSNYSKVILKVDKCTRASLQPRVSSSGDDGEWTHKKTTNIWTGNEHEAIYSIGEYVVDVSAYKYFQLVPIYIQHEVHSSITVRALTTNDEVDFSPTTNITQYRPSPLNPQATVFVPTGDASGFCATDITDDAIYGYYRRIVAKTTDNGETFVELFNHWEDDASPYPQMVKKLGDGQVLAAYNAGEIYKMNDEADAVPRLIMKMPVGRVNIDSISIHKNLILLGEYGPKTLPDNSRRVWISTDYGETFTQIFQEQPRDDYHIHSVTYDPYQDIIWLAVGDTINSNVYFSIDRGENWERVYEWGYCPNQWTSILPLADSVLFLSDNRHMSVYKWTRTKGIEDSISSHRSLEIELAYTFSRDVFETEPLAHAPSADYDNAAGYFGFSQLLDARHFPSVIYGTGDGIRYYPLWTDHKKPNIASGGIRGVFGPNNRGEIVSTVVNSTDNKVVILKIPDWVEI